jgi:hypothetical protein
MTFQALAVRVLIASPSDTSSVRAILRAVIEDWNSVHAEEAGIVLLPVLWERDTTPEMGGEPQSIVNRQIVDAADILVGTFWTRLGTPTADAASGTVEEIERFIRAQKPVLLYFSSEPVIPDSVDMEQYRALREFRTSLQERGLYETFDDTDTLWRKVPAALTRTIREHFRSAIQDSAALSASDDGAVATGATHSPRASLLARLERDREMTGLSSRGQPKYRTRESLLIQNQGTGPAEGLRLRLEKQNESDPGELPRLLNADGPVTRLAPGGSLEFPVLRSLGSVGRFDVVIEWQEGDTPFEDRQSV